MHHNDLDSAGRLDSLFVFQKMKVPFVSTLKLIHFSKLLSDLLGPALYWLLHELQKIGQSPVLTYLTDELGR